MRSLRRQLLLGTALGTAGVLVACGAALYALISRTLRADFDAALAAKAWSLTALFELDGETLESDLGTASLAEFAAAAARPEYYQVWLPDGSIFTRSPSLGTGHLERPPAGSDQPLFGTLRLPDGRMGRSVELRFVPRQESRPGHAPPDSSVTLLVARGTAGLEATLARVRGLLLGVGAVAVGLSAVVLAGVVRRCLRPVAGLSAQIAGVGERELHKRIDDRGVPAELSPIVGRLNDLLARLQAAFERERRFTGDAAHELRTPLAGLRAKLEVALARERSSEEYRAALGDSLAVSVQMQRMVEQLLHMARADAGQLELCRAPLDLAELARECAAAFQERAAARGLRMEWDRRGSAVIESDADTLCLILRNALDNAVTYATAGSPIRIALAEANNGVVLRVSNPTTLSAADAPRVFQRFWQANPARQGQAEGRCGLGLPLCRALVAQLGGTITAELSPARVFTVTVWLPRGGDARR